MSDASRRVLGVARSDQSNHPEEDDGPDERHHQAHQDATTGRAEEGGEEPAAEKGADDPHHDVSDEAESMAADDSAGQSSRDESDQDEQKEVHGVLLGGSARR